MQGSSNVFFRKLCTYLLNHTVYAPEDSGLVSDHSKKISFQNYNKLAQQCTNLRHHVALTTKFFVRWRLLFRVLIAELASSLIIEFRSGP